ncbi:MAG: tRNA (adenosine(37)-N6)-threonylcarbamoyltransferase complex ATPase subunit type 1 TsaE [Patescibacteria group bacterium]|jgi:tRNA threonylcarbamoyladenosine biosynthesis protein TsaE
MEYISHNEKETYALADKIAKASHAGDIFALSGDLGSGKTTFVKAFAKSMNVGQPITSPTFVLIKTYKIAEERIEANVLVHVDAYRLQGESDVEAIGLHEFMQRKDTIVLIEWPERVEGSLPDKTKHISFEYIDENTRKITTDPENNL